MKLNKKAFSVMTTAAMVASVAAPFAATTADAAAGSIVATSVPTVSDGEQELGTIRAIVPAGTRISKGDSVVIKTPYDLIGKFGGKNNINVPAKFSGDDNAFAVGGKAGDKSAAEQAVKDAEKALKDAKEALEDAKKDADDSEEVKDAQQAVEKAEADLKKAEDAVKDAEKDLADAKKAEEENSTGDTRNAVREAQEALDEADKKLAAAQSALKTAKEKLQNAQPEDVKKAEEAVEKAEKALDEAKKDLAEYAGEALVSARQTGSDRITVTYDGPTTNLTEDGVFFVNLGALDVDKGDSGPAEATFEASSSSAFPTGKVTVANVAAKGEVQVSFSSLDTSNNRFDPTINLAETVPGSFARDGEIKIKLPSGYKWANATSSDRTSKYGLTVRDVVVTYGDKSVLDGLTLDTNKAEDELIIKFDSKSKSSQATKIEIKPDFVVDNDSKVKDGDIIARISGKTKTDISSAKIGAYGEYGSKVSVEDATEIVSGKIEQEIGTIVIKETINESLVNNRTVTLTLPESARWNEDTLGDFDSNKSVDLVFVGLTGTDKRTAKFEVRNAGDKDPAKFELENVEVAVDPSFDGELEVEVAGSAGVEGKVTVADVVQAVTVKTDVVPNVSIGLTNQDGASFTLTEKAAEALEDDGRVELLLPEGAKFNGTPKVTVEDGDISISDVKLSDNDRALIFTIDSDSTEASEIKVSDVKIQLDRTLPEGDVKVKVQGSAVVETANVPNQNWNKYVSEFTIAKVATAAPGINKGSTVFTIGSTTYTVGGVEKTADVAPFIDNGRTYLPIRFVAEAIGLPDENIVWNDAARTVTLIKGDRVAQLKIGSNILTLNGVAVPMDVNAVIKDGRTVLPLSFVAQALGAEVVWNDGDRTVTVNQ